MAKYCLSATAKRDGIRLVAAVMTSPDSKVRFREAGQLLDYGFSKCSMYYDENMEKLAPIEVKGSLEKEVPVKYQNEFSYLSTEGEDFSAIEKSIQWNEEIAAPLSAGDEVGAYVYTLNGKEIGRVPIVMEQDVKKAGYPDYLQELWSGWML